MSSIKTKKRLTYTVFATMFLLGGIEYAVILPTLWLYLHETYDSPEYMLGVVLSAYSLAAFLSSPIIGGIVDKKRRTKEILIFCATFQMAGSFLYFVGISQWLCVASRFICGIGGAGEGIVLAEVSRYTSEQERTSIISKLVAFRQIALLGAPGLNLVLRLLHFNIGPFEVNMYTVPGAFMALLWFLLIILIVMVYTEPSKVFNEEKKKKKNALETDEIKSIKRLPVDTPVIKEVLSPTPTIKILSSDDKPKSKETVPLSNSMNESNEVMASAERFIRSSELNNQLEASQASGEFVLDDSWSLIEADEAPLLSEAEGRTVSNNFQNSANDDYIQNYELNMDDLIAREGKLGFFCKEYIRDNVMAIVTLLFCAMFSQISLEAMCTQVSLEYLDFGEFENSVLYSLCGVEIVIVYIAVSVMSNYVQDRNMILFGGVILLASNIILIIFLPTAPVHDRAANIGVVSVAVALDVFSLPFLVVCATSLYSKMTRRETQGLSQGLRRSIVGLGTILAPLWASSIVSKPYLVLGVLIGIQSLAMLMCLMSYKRLVGLESGRSETLSPKAVNRSPRPGSTTSSSTVVPPNAVNASNSTQYGSIDSTDSYACRYSALKSQENV